MQEGIWKLRILNALKGEEYILWCNRMRILFSGVMPVEVLFEGEGIDACIVAYLQRRQVLLNTFGFRIVFQETCKDERDDIPIDIVGDSEPRVEGSKFSNRSLYVRATG